MLSTRNQKIKIICHNTKHRIINQIIFEEFINNSGNRWENKASERLFNEFNIKISPQTLINYKKNIKDGTRNPFVISNFCNGHYTSRYGKDIMYSKMDTLIDVFINDKKYIGLPANQILSINNKYGSSNVVICEKDKSMAKFMFNMQRCFSTPKDYSKIENIDIFEYLNNTNKKFSIFDLDLMCIMKEELVYRIVNCLKKVSLNKSIINIVSVIGRKISNKDYDKIMPRLFKDLISDIFDIIYNTNGTYLDRIYPIRYEIFVLNRRIV